MGLMHTNIPELTGVDLEFVGFAYGGPLNQAALAGQIDVLLTADQPAIALLSRTDQYKVVARMMNNRTCLYVPNKSPVKTLADLPGTSIAGPVGAAAERVALEALGEAGLDLASIRFGSIDMAQQAALIAAGEADGRWANFDALYGFDPMPAVFETEGAARMIHCAAVVSVIVANEEMLTVRRDDLERFLLAFLLSWYQFAQHPDTMNAIFVEQVQLHISPEALEIAASVEPNRRAKAISDIQLTFDHGDFDTFDAASAFLVERGIIEHPVDMRADAHTDTGPLMAVLAEDRASQLAPRIRMLK
jgi:ABC-type nitrate/sulfonate/bicarbonate transport system substrate-binding protein